METQGPAGDTAQGLTRFTVASILYVILCLVLAAVIVLRGVGPHPLIIALYPPNGDRYFPGGIVEITFSHPMDQSSVERALQVTPGSQGQGTWYGNTLNLQPVGDWRPNVTYHVSLTGSVTDDQGRSLKTPITFWFRVHYLRGLVFCTVHGLRNVCEKTNLTHALIPSPTSILSFALSPDGTLLAYTRRDNSGLPHLFLVNADGTHGMQLTRGGQYADSDPSWAPGDSNDITYIRRAAVRTTTGWRLGTPHRWGITITGASNSPL